ncbi:glutamate racemase [Helicobacter sp. 16-1353]|uniref:glutamate racemase n=1 Tax=Helicobacter sp. 16-1353 TaxID=2004996 RepID=UPI000DCE8D2E|nr:glutamate racemase [Helicobacter sp. 16-1353]RAX51712.1 glutamate racemase [Helicobacter sp. 16-1353]
MKIGVFDSGIGGLTVLKSLVNSRCFSEIIYYGDTARVPYGVKDKETIIRFSIEAVDFFNRFNIDMLIVACNTVSAYAINAMRKYATYPIVGVIEPGVLSLSNKISDKNKNILIIATKATTKSRIYEKKLHKLGYKNTHSLQTGFFVPLVEEGIFKGKLLNTTFEYYFANTKIPDAIILGCTHFPLIQNEIKKYFHNKPILIHSGDAIIEYLIKKYRLKKVSKKMPKISYFASANPKSIKDSAKIWLK